MKSLRERINDICWYDGASNKWKVERIGVFDHESDALKAAEESLKNPHAQALGSLGGNSKSEAKRKSSAENGKKGGRPLRFNTVEEMYAFAKDLLGYKEGGIYANRHGRFIGIGYTLPASIKQLAKNSKYN